MIWGLPLRGKPFFFVVPTAFKSKPENRRGCEVDLTAVAKFGYIIKAREIPYGHSPSFSWDKPC